MYIRGWFRLLYLVSLSHGDPWFCSSSQVSFFLIWTGRHAHVCFICDWNKNHLTKHFLFTVQSFLYALWIFVMRPLLEDLTLLTAVERRLTYHFWDLNWNDSQLSGLALPHVAFCNFLRGLASYVTFCTEVTYDNSNRARHGKLIVRGLQHLYASVHIHRRQLDSRTCSSKMLQQIPMGTYQIIAWTE